jgi:hypothetical protein
MMRNLLLSFVVAVPLALVACTAEKPAEPAKATAPAPANAAPAADLVVSEPTVHDVMCGCSIDGVGRCGNYIMIEGSYVPLVHPKLGKMEWCAQKSKGAKIETTGAMKDGKFVASDWKTVQ